MEGLDLAIVPLRRHSGCARPGRMGERSRGPSWGGVMRTAGRQGCCTADTSVGLVGLLCLPVPEAVSSNRVWLCLHMRDDTADRSAATLQTVSPTGGSTAPKPARTGPRPYIRSRWKAGVKEA